ncbi:MULTISPECIES: low specificity L-threonine aldolase [unclassified Achromobacter]|uniref:threonine aldolase family protein n=1 Tax=unclassified Achromobacter TaxID=2626865 RepID=UPI000B51A23C|nr:MULTISPECIES: beta-eliminating lyase-related protein [unclassified Achromobacter]OWT68823.1 low specificity L-threonine aldolase [Achromobacter sp. HZ28]OWT78614.1 low specificity L-threonine aldolase [Achromobacter sp. HZ34]
MIPTLRSDNIATAHPSIVRAVAEANEGPAAAYGDDDYTALMNRRFSDFFGTKAVVFPVSTGTAANALSLASCARPYGGIYCHQEAHIHTAEGGATEAYTGGAKLIPLPGADYKLSPDVLADALRHAERGVRNRPQPDAVSITQASEYGTVYGLDEIGAIGAAVREAGVVFHMDGARFANALATLGCEPADMTWRQGVDILSFGCTKNGGMNTEAIVVFKPALVEPLSYHLRRAGQTWSKMRFSAAQLMAYIDNGLLLQLAGQANALAARLGRELSALPGAELVAPVQANLVFLRLPQAAIDKLAEAGVRFARRRGGIIRLVTRFDGSQEEVDAMVTLTRAALGGV